MNTCYVAITLHGGAVAQTLAFGLREDAIEYVVKRCELQAPEVVSLTENGFVELHGGDNEVRIEECRIQ